jgi:hypothetical protein
MRIDQITKQNVKRILAETKEFLQAQAQDAYEPKTIIKVMKILEADIWCQFWQSKRNFLCHGNGVLQSTPEDGLIPEIDDDNNDQTV